MQKLNFQGNTLDLWIEMDADNSGELTLDEIDQEGSDLWMSFRMWCHSASMWRKVLLCSGCGPAP